jgi:proteasome lid subunit RPN8/RPN11
MQCISLMGILSFIQGLLVGGVGKPVERVIVKRTVIEDIMEFAKANSRREFIALLEGTVDDGKAIVTGVLYQPFTSSEYKAVVHINLPMTSSSIGSVHSHPSGGNTPSGQDLLMFTRTGIVHLIICYPFREQDIACWDLHGNRTQFIVEN